MICLLTSIAQGDIFNWQTGEVIPGTEGITPKPDLDFNKWNTEAKNLRYADFSGKLNLSKCYFSGSWLDYADFSEANLEQAWFVSSTLTGANLRLTDLTDARFYTATLTDVDFSGAILSGTFFSNTTGFTKEQFYSTASYQNGYLFRVDWSNIDMTGWSFSNQELNGAHFSDCVLVNADFSGVKHNIRNSTAFINTDLTGASFRNADLSIPSTKYGVYFKNSIMNNVDLNGATLINCAFNNPIGLTEEQIYSTASYQTGDMREVKFIQCDLTNWNFANQNLTSASFESSNLNGTDFSGTIIAKADFTSSTLTNINLSKANLNHANFSYATLNNTNLSGTNLSYANFRNADLTDADLSDAIVTNAFFWSTAGFTQKKLYSTASYQSGDLRGIRLWEYDLTGWNFANQNLTGADFYRATLTGVDLSGAIVVKTAFNYTTGFTRKQLYSTASYQAGDLHGIELRYNALDGWNFANQNLTGADFYNATLADADLSGAMVAEADFGRSPRHYNGLSQQQLYSTASYQAGDLHGLKMHECDLTGWDLADQNLKGAEFWSATLTGANLSGANLANASFDSATLDYANLKEGNLIGVDFRGSKLTSADLRGANLTTTDFRGATLAGADLSGADTRGAVGLNYSGVIALNTIRPAGRIWGLDLMAGEVLHIRDYNGEVGITINTRMEMASDAVLHMFLADTTWGSTISVEAGIPVDLGGILKLDFVDLTNTEALIETTFNLFNWNGTLTEGNCFNEIMSLPGYQWDLSDLYTTGEVTLVAVPEPATVVLLGLGLLILRKRQEQRRV